MARGSMKSRNTRAPTSASSTIIWEKKQKLFLAVLERAYDEIREAEAALVWTAWIPRPQCGG